MKNIIITEPTVKDFTELKSLFETVIDDTFAKNELVNLTHLAKEEVEDKMRLLALSLKSIDKEYKFLIAKKSDRIVGTVAFGRSSTLISELTDCILNNTVEIGTLFVLPEYQGQGIGNLLLESALKIFENDNIKSFCLDSGYKTAQKIWIKKFGQPRYFIKDFWAVNLHHMIWCIDLSAK